MRPMTALDALDIALETYYAARDVAHNGGTAEIEARDNALRDVVVARARAEEAAHSAERGES